MKIKNVAQLELVGVAVETEAGLAVVRAEEEGTKKFVPTNPATCESKESCLRDASPKKPKFESRVPENVEAEEDCLALAGAVQTDENPDLVPGVGVEPTRYRYR